MRVIEETRQFKRDLRREAQDPHRETLRTDFIAILAALANDQPLADRHRDHALTGDWKNHRECHVRPDLLLIYKKQGNTEGGFLFLTRLGSHGELFG